MLGEEHEGPHGGAKGGQGHEGSGLEFKGLEFDFSKPGSVTTRSLDTGQSEVGPRQTSPPPDYQP